MEPGMLWRWNALKATAVGARAFKAANVKGDGASR
jgi:hypothetical protein